MLIQKTTVDTNGKIPISSKLRKMINIKPGDEVILKIINGEINISSYANSLQHVRSLVRKYTNRSLLESLEEIRSLEKKDE